jgi:hypothetical protein
VDAWRVRKLRNRESVDVEGPLAEPRTDVARLRERTVPIRNPARCATVGGSVKCVFLSVYALLISSMHSGLRKISITWLNSESLELWGQFVEPLSLE